MTRTSLLLPLYRLTSASIRPFVPAVLGWRRRRGYEDRHRFRERMGVAGLPRPDGRLVWVHAASTADGQILLPLVVRLGARGFHVLISTRTLASANALKRMLPAGSFHQFMPIDVPAFVARFLDHWRPDMVLLAGAELWPNVLVEAAGRDLPVIFVNARMSDRVYRHWRRLPAFVRTLMMHVDLCLARSDHDAERFLELGTASVQTVGDLVFDQPLPQADPVAVGAFSMRAGGRPIWVAAQVEPEEAPFVLDVHRRLLPRFPNLLTVVVPRLPRDGARIAAAAKAQNLAVALKSRDGLPQRLPGLFVADIAGEIGIYYRAAGIAYLGGSKTTGRSPIEAAKLGCAVFHGARISDFAQIYQALDRSQGGGAVKDAAGFAQALAGLFDDGARLRLMQRNAAQTVDRLCGGTGRIMRAIEPHVIQMMIDR